MTRPSWPMLRRIITLVLTGLTLGVAIASVATGVSAQDSGTDASIDMNVDVIGPLLTPSTRSIEPGQRIDVIFSGWTARYATLSVCGNLAERGSADCNMVESTGVRLFTSSGEFAAVQDMVVVAPPTDCPCVIRAVAGDNGEVSVAPIELIGHPISAVIDPNLGQPLVAVDVTVADAAEGAIASLRQSLGGPSPQLATVTVKNVTTEPVSGVAVHGSALRSGDSVADFDLTTGEIGPGRTWTGQAEVELPPPSIGAYEWSVSASGAGPVVTADASSQSTPWLLLLLVLVLVWDVVAMVVRRVQRRRARERALSVARPVDPEAVIDIRDRAPQAPPPPPPPTGPQVPTSTHEPVGASVGPG